MTGWLRRSVAHVLVPLVVVLGCGDGRRCGAVGEGLDRRAADATVSEFAMVEVAPFEWDRVFLFGEYAAAESIRRSTGFDYRGRVLDPAPHVPEQTNLLVFVGDGTPICFDTIKIPGREEEGWVFSPDAFDASGLERGEAVFRVERADRLTVLGLAR
jgi:hypothetical protein